MSFLEQCRPKKWSELIGNKKGIAILKSALPQKRAFIYGPPGCGKTSFALLYGEINGYTIIHLNASDNRTKEVWNDLYKQSRTGSKHDKKLFIIDECDGIEWWRYYKRIFDIIRINTHHPFIFIANDGWKIKKYEERYIREYNKGKKIKSLKELFIKVPFYAPSLTEIIGRFKNIEKEQKLKFNYKYLTTDLRASLLAVISQSEKVDTHEKTVYEILTDLFEKGITEHISFPDHIIWIYDCIPKAYKSMDMLDAYNLLIEAVSSYRPQLLQSLPRAKIDFQFERPFYYKRLQQFKMKNKLFNGEIGD